MSAAHHQDDFRPTGRYLTPRQFARLLPELSETTVRRMVRDGSITAARIGSGRGRIFIPDTEVERIRPIAIRRMRHVDWSERGE